ncbi:hypothetical protein AT4G23020 [Arabidopsis thaliana]|uniref:DUF4378 domain-containing protein n=1 Tax=Arabidopsis thaliana TaxID=3702 RepID=F4JMR3_ARATH|nr:uncharacterized protein AT4G23020 [Arabidopsis thaliana]AEE84696.1 hypothetical protein AT4G23020 [Arabidopsis thaliana]|eukprot:NP_001190807.1 hypothetical protein AT4G23020 [Arabidopsis thaliana]
MTSISSSDHPLPVSKKRLKPLILRDFLLDDLSSCSSNGFKSFPRLLNAEIQRSGMFHHNRRITCGLAFSHAVHKASTALLTAVKLLPFPSSVKSQSRDRDNKKGLFSRSFWKKLSRRELNVDVGEKERRTDDREEEIQRCRSFAEFLQESQDQLSDQIYYISPTDLFSGEATLSKDAVGDSSSFSSEDSEVTQSSSGVIVVMMSGDCVGSHVSDGSSLNDNTEIFLRGFESGFYGQYHSLPNVNLVHLKFECENEEKEQLSPISILDCPFQDDAISPPSHHKETYEKKQMRKRRRLESLVRLEPVDLEKRIEKYEERQDYKSHIIEIEEDQSEIRANRLFALVKSRIIEEQNQLLASHVVDNVLLDFFKENNNNETRDEDKLVEIVEEWVMRRQDDEYNMFMSWKVSEKREIYVKEMKWGCINGDEKEYVVEELGNGFLTSLVDELIHDISL